MSEKSGNLAKALGFSFAWRRMLKRLGVTFTPAALPLVTVGAGKKFTRARGSTNAPLTSQRRRFPVSFAFAVIIVEGRMSVVVAERRRLVAYFVIANRGAITIPNPLSSTFHCLGHIATAPTRQQPHPCGHSKAQLYITVGIKKNSMMCAPLSQ